MDPKVSGVSVQVSGFCPTAGSRSAIQIEIEINENRTLNVQCRKVYSA